MLASIDKGFVELLNKKTGLQLTYKEFCDLVSERKKERDNDPAIQARKRMNAKINAMMFDAMS